MRWKKKMSPFLGINTNPVKKKDEEEMEDEDE